jgi:hypothetical protein
VSMICWLGKRMPDTVFNPAIWQRQSNR